MATDIKTKKALTEALTELLSSFSNNTNCLVTDINVSWHIRRSGFGEEVACVVSNIKYDIE